MGVITTANNKAAESMLRAQTNLTELVTSGRESIASGAATLEATMQSWTGSNPYGDDIIQYVEGEDNAQTYWKHEMLIDVHDDWLKQQSKKCTEHSQSPTEATTSASI